MSASEKLKALDALNTTDPANWTDHGEVLLEALPQIVAVVEALQEVRCQNDISYACTKRDLKAGTACFRCAALSALEGVLS